jgi:hypothetical protein
MANTDKNIVITPNKGSLSDDPKMVFSGADASTPAQDITLYAYPTDNGTLSFEGSAGQLFSITNSLSGTIFSVNDISGIPSIEVDDDGTIRLAEFAGNILVGTAIDDGTSRLQVNGDAKATNLLAGEYALSTSNSITLATTSLTLVDATSATNFRTVKYLVQITQGTSYQSSEVLILHNGTTTYLTEYAILRNGSNLGTLSSDISGGNIRLLVTMATSATAFIKVFKTAIEI